MTNSCTCKAEHWQPHKPDCPAYDDYLQKLREAHPMEKLQAEITQLRGNLSLAEEGLANYALEVAELKRWQLEARKLMNSPADEPEASHYCIDCNEAHDPRTCGALKSEGGL